MVGLKVRERSSAKKNVSAELIAKAEILASTEIAFIDHPDFHRPGLRVDALDDFAEASSVHPRFNRTGMAFLPEFFSASLLTFDQEQRLFFQMNAFRFRAEQLRRKLQPQRPNGTMIAEIQRCLAQADTARNRIAEANVRLLVAAGKKLAHSLDQLSELISEGLMPLMRAIDLFDVSRGHRFSTYATWAVRNQMIRTLRKQRTLPELARSDEQAGWQHIADHRATTTIESVPLLLKEETIRELMTVLSSREQKIVRARFGLDGEPCGQSYAQISGDLGLSKERVRQILVIALEKLRHRAIETGLVPSDDLVHTP